MPAARQPENRERNGHVLVWDQNSFNEIFEENRPRGDWNFIFFIFFYI